MFAYVYKEIYLDCCIAYHIILTCILHTTYIQSFEHDYFTLYGMVVNYMSFQTIFKSFGVL